jgi:Ca2+/Na+ antiporter
MHRLLLILHIGFAIFTLGPLTAALMATPRYIRNGDLAVVRHLRLTTQVYGLGALGVLVFGIFLAEGKFSRVWLSASMTLFIVALVLLLIVERDVSRAVRAMESAATPPQSVEPAPPAETAADQEAAEDAQLIVKPAVAPPDLAQVERGRITSLSGVIGLIWIVILVLMIWH